MPKKAMKKLEKPPQEAPEVAEEPEIAEIPKLSEEPASSLDDKLLQIYTALPPGVISMQYLIDETGASESDISLAWHRLFDAHKVPLPQLAKPA